MHSLSTLIYIAAGRPTVEAMVTSESGPCWFCGATMERGRAVADWAGEGFNAYNRAKRRNELSATHICEACVFVCSRLSPVPGRPAKPGKKFGGNYRNYSHGAALRGDGSVRYVSASKAENAELVEFMLAPGSAPWGVAVATSGQKHVISHAPMNSDSEVCQVAFEDLVIRFSRREFAGLLAVMNQLRVSSGCSADALATKIYHPKDLQRDLVGVEAFEREHGHRRGSGMFDLAVFLSTRSTVR
jgi:hypothetical protein